MSHGERRADPVRGHEAELPSGDGVPAAGHEHRAKSPDRGLTRRPLREWQEWMARPPCAVRVERAAVRSGLLLGL